MVKVNGHFGQNQNQKIISRLKIVYINNILFIYTIFRTFFSHQISSLTTLTMTTLTTIYPKKSTYSESSC